MKIDKLNNEFLIQPDTAKDLTVSELIELLNSLPEEVKEREVLLAECT